MELKIEKVRSCNVKDWVFRQSIGVNLPIFAGFHSIGNMALVHQSAQTVITHVNTDAYNDQP